MKTRRFCDPFSLVTTQVVSMPLAIVAMLVALMVVLTDTSRAQQFQTIYTFGYGSDGTEPVAGLTVDRAGNLHGATEGGGIGWGTVYKLSKQGSGWNLTTLYTFQGGTDGAFPESALTIGADGALYGTTQNGGAECSCGTVYRLAPPPTACRAGSCSWKETVLHRFTGGTDGSTPYSASVSFDRALNLYGTTFYGGTGCEPLGCGTVYELTTTNRGGWMYRVVYRFTGESDGAAPMAGVIPDLAGNLYGSTMGMEDNPWGSIFELIPVGDSWTMKILSDMSDDEAEPVGIIFDQQGNLYGTTVIGGENGVGSVFELVPSAGGWRLRMLYSFSGVAAPFGKLATNATGNLYGTTLYGGAYGCGNVYKLTRGNGGWTYTSLHDFTGGTDGGTLLSGVTVDVDGDVYGTAAAGGPLGGGVVFEITP